MWNTAAIGAREAGDDGRGDHQAVLYCTDYCKSLEILK
jgi:hypothetical protein